MPASLSDKITKSNENFRLKKKQNVYAEFFRAKINGSKHLFFYDREDRIQYGIETVKEG